MVFSLFSSKLIFLNLQGFRKFGPEGPIKKIIESNFLGYAENRIYTFIIKKTKYNSLYFANF